MSQTKDGKGRLPEFMIIGAAKSGTTALFRYLGRLKLTSESFDVYDVNG